MAPNVRIADWLRRPRNKWLALGTSICVLWFVVHTAILVFDGLTDEDVSADIAVVFGNTVLPSGQPSLRLRTRLDAAAALHKQGKVPAILVSGGFGKEGFDEALVMRDALVAQGLSVDEVIVDQQGYTTEATCRAAAALAKQRGWKSAIAVTQFHHVSRAKLALRRAGIPTVAGAHARNFEMRDLYSVVREFFAWHKYALLMKA